ncbi:MAG: C40 family peptidase [Bacteroidetes bacterium]|nr:C40 family peptidase [Bacteroidota bacterium]
MFGFAKSALQSNFNDTLIGGSADIAKQVQLIEKEHLQTGDLLFFRIKRKRISHVGVYLGNNKFVHAAVKGGVQINDLNEPYYKRYFIRRKRTSSKLG